MRGYTIEMSFLMPIILLLIMSSIYAVFYYHDKNIIAGAAYETAVVGSRKTREKDGVSEDQLKTLFHERVDGKCILLTTLTEQVEVSEEQVQVNVSAYFGKMRTSISKRCAVTDPEHKIRENKKLKEFINGT